MTGPRRQLTRENARAIARILAAARQRRAAGLGVFRCPDCGREEVGPMDWRGWDDDCPHRPGTSHRTTRNGKPVELNERGA